MPLNDYEFKLNDTGVLLNEDTQVVPFLDIERVSGLDNAPYRETIRDHEGNDGGFLDAEFERGRDIILDGIAYCDPDDVETFLDDLKENYAPVSVAIPFYFKPPGVAERLLFVKPRGAKFDWELARRIGMTNVQLLLYAEDPRIYASVLSSLVIPFGGVATSGFGFDNSIDFFDRTETDTWGDLDTGETWVNAGGVASDFSVNGSKGNHLHTAVGSPHTSTFGSFANVDIRSRLVFPAVATGGIYEIDLVGRFVDGNNFYQMHVTAQTTGQLNVGLGKIVAGAFTEIDLATSVMAYSAGTNVMARLVIDKSFIMGKIWAVGTTEPTAWTVEATDTALTAAAAVGTRTQRGGGNTNSNLTVSYEDWQLNRGFDFNLDFGDVVPPTGGTVIVGGNRPTPAVMTLTGPMVDPIIFNQTDSKRLGFTGLNLGVGDSLVIDLLDRTVILNDVTNMRSTLTTAEWWLFNPGSTFVVLGGGSGSGELLIEYRDAWR
jgi:hypothetical protein